MRSTEKKGQSRINWQERKPLWREIQTFFLRLQINNRKINNSIPHILFCQIQFAMDDIVIRAAREADMPQIERIIRHYILTTVSTIIK